MSPSPRAMTTNLYTDSHSSSSSSPFVLNVPSNTSAQMQIGQNSMNLLRNIGATMLRIPKSLSIIMMTMIQVGNTFLELKEELWAVRKQPELRHDLLKRRKRKYMMRMLQSFLSDAWKDAGHSFLEDVAQNLKKGLYVPDGFAPSTKEGVFEAGKSSPGKLIHASSKNSRALLSNATGDKIVGTSIPKSFSRNTCMPSGSILESSGSILERPNDVSMVNDSSNKVHTHHGSLSGRHAITTDLMTRPSVLGGSFPPNAIDSIVLKDREGPSSSKDFEKGPHLPGRPSLESLVDAFNTNDPRYLLACTELIPVEQKHTQVESLSWSKRRIPSLQGEKKADSNTDVSHAVKRRVTRSSSLVGIDTAVVNGSSGYEQETLNSVLYGIPGLKDTCIADVGKICPTEAMEGRDQGAHDLVEEELMCPSPPPWAGSPGMNCTVTTRNCTVTTRKRPRLAPFCLHGTDTSNTVAAVGDIGHIETPVILKAQSELREGQASLIAVVQDPLPEALKIAEEVAKPSDLVRQVREQTFSVNDKNQGTQSVSNNNNNVVQVLEGAIQGPQEKPSKKSIMDRNPTAHTVEWETSDDIADSSDDKSPSRSRQIHLPGIRPRQSFALQGDVVACKEPQRRKFQKWTEEETNVLRK